MSLAALRHPRPCQTLLFLLLFAGQALAGPNVVVSIAPLHSLVASVMQGVGTPDLLLRGGESPHAFSLRPSDARTLHRADVVFWIGPPLELPLARILPNLGNAQAIAMLDAPGMQLLPYRQMRAADGHGHDHGHGETAQVDPHVWLSPANARAMVGEIVRVLGRIDPSRQALYAANAQRLRTRLGELDLALRAQLRDLHTAFAVFHDAYQYLEHSYDLASVGTVRINPERAPGAAHLAALRAMLQRQAVRCLFSEPQFDPGLVETVTRGLPIRHAVLDPLGADIPPGPDAYDTLMRSLATTLAGCLRAGDTP